MVIFSKAAWKSAVYWHKRLHRGKDIRIRHICMESYADLQMRTVKLSVARVLVESHKLAFASKRVLIFTETPFGVYVSQVKRTKQ